MGTLAPFFVNPQHAANSRFGVAITPRRRAAMDRPKPCGGCREPEAKPCDGCQLDVAVVVPCHNYGRFLRECLDSVLAEKPREVVVVLDDCSDDSEAIAAEYAGRGVRSIATQCCDIHLARRLGMRSTSAPFLVFLDADDKFLPGYLRACRDGFTSDDIGVVTGAAQEFGLSNGRWKPEPTLHDIENVNTVASASMVRRAALVESEALDDVRHIGIHSQDWETWKAIVRAGWKIGEAPTAYGYRRHDNNHTLTCTADWAKRFYHHRRASRAKPRVIHITPSHCHGGVSRHLDQLCRHAKGLDWAGVVLMDAAGSDDAAVSASGKFMPCLGGELRHATQNSALVERRKSAAAALEELAAKADVIYSWGLGADLLKPYVGKKPILFAVHCSGAWGQKSSETCGPLADRIVTVSRGVYQHVPENCRGKAVVIDNGADLKSLVPTESREETRRSWGLGPRQMAVGLVGRWSWEKNNLALAHAVAALGPNFVGVSCGPQSANRAARVPAADVTTAERLTGGRMVWTFSETMGEVYQALDCLIIPSHEEGSPIVAAEAFAMGCPVVSCPVGMMTPDQIGETFVPVPLKPTGRQLAAAVHQALEGRTVEAARELALGRLNVVRMAREWERLILEMV